MTGLYSRITTFSDFGDIGNIGPNVNDSFIMDNDNGHSTVFFHVTPPTGGKVIFEGSPDSVNWDSLSMRSTSQDKYIFEIDTSDFIIGSISCLRKFRVRTTEEGSAPGTIRGRCQVDVAVTEGSEFSNRPDKIGAILITKSASFTTQQTDTVIWAPSFGNRFFVTSYKINATGIIDGVVTLFDETNAVENYIMPPTFYNVSNNQSLIDNEILVIPYKSNNVGNSVKVTSSANISFNITVRGYEAP